MKQVSINHHYIPQMYLRNWSQDGKKVWVYRKLVSHKDVPCWEIKSIDRIGSMPQAYSHIHNGQETDEFENWLNYEIETPAKPIIDKIINGESVSNDEWLRLLRFTVAQMARTVAYFAGNYETMLAAGLTVMKQWEQSESVFSYIAKNKQAKPLPLDEYMPIKQTILSKDENVTTVKREVAIGRTVWLSHIKRMVNEHLSYFVKCKWYILEPADGVEWPTSDNPVICRFNKGNGVLNRGNEIVFPLSPKHLLYTCVGNNHSMDTLNKNDRFSRLVWREILQNGFLCVYSKSRQKGMFKNCPRTVDETEYNRILQEMQNWHGFHSKIEAKYYQNSEATAE